MNMFIGLIIALMVTASVAPQTKSVVDPIIVGVAVGAIAAPLAVSAGVTGSSSILGTVHTNVNVIATGAGAVASAAQAKSQIEETE